MARSRETQQRSATMRAAQGTAFRRIDSPEVSGFLHSAGGTGGLALTHGAGASCDSPLLVIVAEAFAARGITVLRFDLAFRRKRRFGPPHPSGEEQDRASIRQAMAALRAETGGAIYLGGHSYGGRQATMLAAEEPGISAGLLLFSYPLHPPNKPDQLRTAHFANIRDRAVFVHGDSDPFGSIAEMTDALRLIPALTDLIALPGAGHDLRKGRFDLAPVISILTLNRA